MSKNEALNIRTHAIPIASPAEPSGGLGMAVRELRAGRPIIVVDDEDRENEGDVVIAAEFVDAADINFMAREARGLVCIAMTGEDLDRLGIPMMIGSPGEPHPLSSPFTVSVEARVGITTGISAADRARSARVLVDQGSGPNDISMPGHLFPLRAQEGGVRVRRGHTEASVDLMRLAGLMPAAVICEIMDPDGTMARRDSLEAFAARHGLLLITIAELADSLERLDPSPLRSIGHLRARPNASPAPDLMVPNAVTRVASAKLPTKYGPFAVYVYRDAESREHMVLERRHGSPAHSGRGMEGDTPGAAAAPLVRIHSECLTGDVLGSLRCDCGDQLDHALRQLADEPHALLVYLRQEGRGIGLGNKIKAYALQEQGLDTVEANVCLGFEPDERDYAVAAAILSDRSVSAVRLLTNNPAKVESLERDGVRVVERLPLLSSSRPENVDYLRTKAERMRHQLGIEPHEAA